MPFGLVPFLLLAIPILEIAVFILAGGQIGIIATLGFILLTAIIGSIMLRIQGLSTLANIQRKLHAGETPAQDMVTGVMVLLAGVLLLTPGFITDAVGFLLFFPPFQKLIWNSIASKVVVNVPGGPSRQDHRQNKRDGKDIVDLDPSEFSETPNPDSPWGEKNHR